MVFPGSKCKKTGVVSPEGKGAHSGKKPHSLNKLLSGVPDHHKCCAKLKNNYIVMEVIGIIATFALYFLLMRYVSITYVLSFIIIILFASLLLLPCLKNIREKIESGCMKKLHKILEKIFKVFGKCIKIEDNQNLIAIALFSIMVNAAVSLLYSEIWEGFLRLFIDDLVLIFIVKLNVHIQKAKKAKSSVEDTDGHNGNHQHDAHAAGQNPEDNRNVSSSEHNGEKPSVDSGKQSEGEDVSTKAENTDATSGYGKEHLEGDTNDASSEQSEDKTKSHDSDNAESKDETQESIKSNSSPSVSPKKQNSNDGSHGSANNGRKSPDKLAEATSQVTATTADETTGNGGTVRIGRNDSITGAQGPNIVIRIDNTVGNSEI